MIVFVVIDGVKSSIAAKLKLFKQIAKHGAYTLDCKTVYPPLTEPCFAAMLHSLDPVHLGCWWMTSKRWPTDAYKHYPPGVVSLFAALKESGKTSAVVGTWKELGGVVNMKHTEDGTRRVRDIDKGVTEEAIAKIGERKVDVLMVYFEGPDHTGHESGVGQKYLDSLVEVQKNLMLIIKSMNLTRDTLVVTSDHGRESKNHSAFVDDVMKVPLLFMGRHIKNGYRLNGFISNLDVAPTICALARAKVPAVWRGRILKDIIG